MTAPTRDAIFDIWREELFCWLDASLANEPEDLPQGPATLALAQEAEFLLALQNSTAMPSRRSRRADQNVASGSHSLGAASQTTGGQADTWGSLPPVAELVAEQAPLALSSRRLASQAPLGLQPPITENIETAVVQVPCAVPLRRPTPRAALQREESDLQPPVAENVETAVIQAPRTILPRRHVPRAASQREESDLQPPASNDVEIAIAQALHAIPPRYSTPPAPSQSDGLDLQPLAIDIAAEQASPALSPHRSTQQAAAQSEERHLQHSAGSVEHSEPGIWLSQPLSTCTSHRSVPQVAPQGQGWIPQPPAGGNTEHVPQSFLSSSPCLVTPQVAIHQHPANIVTTPHAVFTHYSHNHAATIGDDIFAPDLPRAGGLTAPVVQPQPADIEGLQGYLQPRIQELQGTPPLPATAQDRPGGNVFRPQLTPILTAFLGDAPEQVDMLGTHAGPRRSGRAKTTQKVSQVDVPAIGKKASGKVLGVKKRTT